MKKFITLSLLLTICGILSAQITIFPHTEYFDNITAPALPNGWTAIYNGNSTIRTYSWEARTPPNHIQIYRGNNSDDLMLISPWIANIQTKMVSFYAKGGWQDNQTLLVGTVSDISDPSTWQEIATIPLDNHDYDAPENIVSLATATGDYLAFRHEDFNYRQIYIDDVMIDFLPTGIDFWCSHDELDFICAGINHQTWYISIKKNGVELRDKLLEAMEKHEQFSKEEKVRIDILRRFGYYSTESNGHLSEYLAWYRKRPDDIPGWIDLSTWIHGETGGYLRVCKEGRNWFETDFPNLMKEPPKKYDGSERGVEHGSYIIEALETRRVYRGHFNVINNGCITNLPEDCVVEVPCYADGNGISVPKVGALTDGCASICSQSINVQRLAVKAAVSGDINLLKQAALLDPLTGAVCNPAEVWQMVDEMLIAQEQWLPQYKEKITAIKIGWEKAERSGTLIPAKDYKGAARLKEATVEDMANNAEKMRKLASASAKEKVDMPTRTSLPD